MDTHVHSLNITCTYVLIDQPFGGCPADARISSICARMRRRRNLTRYRGSKRRPGRRSHMARHHRRLRHRCFPATPRTGHAHKLQVSTLTTVV
jgi:hypothetical protein